MSSSSSPSKKRKTDNNKVGQNQQPPPPHLPPPLIARILSYNVESTADLARLRLVTCNRQINDCLVGAVVAKEVEVPSSAVVEKQTTTSSAEGSVLVKDGHALGIPNRKPSSESFLDYLLGLSHQDDWQDDYACTAGNAFEISDTNTAVGGHIFPGARVARLFPVAELTQEGGAAPPFSLRASPPGSNESDAETNDLLDQVCHEFANLWREPDELVERIDKNDLALPLSKLPLVDGQRAVRFHGDDDDDDEHSHVVVRFLLSVKVPVGAPCLHKIIRERESDTDNENVLLVQLRTDAGPTSDEDEYEEDHPLRPLEHNCVYTAPVVSFHAAAQEEEEDEDEDEDSTIDEDSYFETYVLLDLVCKKEYLQGDAVYEWTTLRYLPLDRAWDHFSFSPTMVEGVAIVDRLLTSTAAHTLNQQINALALAQEQASLVDYHPRSNNIVRDILHPALYVYVKGQSPLRMQVDDVEPCLFPNNRKVKQQAGKDFWGRTYETSQYQWLPTYFSISASGSCIIEDYINNLPPRHDPVHQALYSGLENLFEHCLPFIESVYGYVLVARRKMQGQNDADDDEEEGEPQPFRFQAPTCDPLEMEPCSLRGQKLQVITKIVDYELDPGQSHGGVWHVEGMSHEEIVLTALYIADRDESVDGAALCFKRAFFQDEVRMIGFHVAQDRPPAVEKAIVEGLTPLGSVETPKGRLIVFPNSHVHKVEDMVNDLMLDDDSDDEETLEATCPKAKRRIVVFFLVNPLRRIVSTREVAAQQASQGGWMSLDDARAHRLQLMEERRFHKQDWNVREIHLCEH